MVKGEPLPKDKMVPFESITANNVHHYITQ
jgi:hypothetical protein